MISKPFQGADRAQLLAILVTRNQSVQFLQRGILTKNNHLKEKWYRTLF